MIKDRLTALENRGTPAVFVKIIKDENLELVGEN